MRFNSTGAFVSGCGGMVSWNGVVIADFGWSPQWLDDRTVIANVLLAGVMKLAIFDVLNPAAGWTVIDTESNFLCGRGGRWAAWRAGTGVFGDVGHRPTAGLAPVSTDQRGAAGPDGTIALVRDYQSSQGLVLVRPDGSELDVPGAGWCQHVQVLGPDSALWNTGAYNFELGPVVRPSLRYRYAGGWLAYECALGLVAHPKGHPEVGRILSPATAVQSFFHHEIVHLPSGQILVGWSTTAGEGPEHMRVVDPLTFPVTDLTQPVEEPIVAINRPLWLGWFEFKPPPQAPPGNSFMNVYVEDGSNGRIKDVFGHQFATWVQGGTVEEIETLARALPDKVVAYWDARQWPRPPHLKPGDWMCVQAYQMNTETLQQFEASVAAQLRTVPAEYQVCLVAQCYTSNVGQTQDLTSLVPVYSRLLRDHPRVTMCLAFSDYGRATGLQDHPEVRPSWQELYNGVTGTPAEEGDVMEFPHDAWDAVVVPMHERFSQQAIDAHPGDTDQQARTWTEWVIQQLKFSYPDQGWCWKSAGPNRPPSKDMVCRSDADWFGGWDMLIAAGANGPRNLAPYPPAWHDLLNPPEGPQHKIDWVTARNWLEQQPADFRVEIIEYDQHVRRSDPKGMLIRFDVTSPRPVAEVRFALNDGASAIVTRFPAPHPPDGRYVRAMAFKPVINGTWQLHLTAKDDQGKEARSDGSHTVTVVP